MPDKTPRALVLAIAREASDRADLAQRIGDGWTVRRAAIQDVARGIAQLDAIAAVILLDGDAQDPDADALATLAAAPFRCALVCIARGLAESALDAWIQRLSPVALLTEPVPAAALRLALRRCTPAQAEGEGAVRNQRRATTLLGVSGAIRGVLDQIRQVAPSRMPVLILGETGTGKELVARAIHEESARAQAPFVAVNCAALPESLLESELFGFERGAFTGAVQRKRGLLEAVSGGTLFLDEIGDMSHALQIKLLRVLETQEVRALGAETDRRIDVRVVSATHRDLETAVKEGEFRLDLYYRINTVTIHLPPLRRRRVDIPFLAQHFAEEFGEAHARRITLDDRFLEALGRHDFPGNVRELRNAVERAIALASPGSTIGEQHLALRGGGVGPTPPAHGTLRERVDRLEAEAIEEALRASHGNRTQAAAVLGLSRLGLRQKMKRLGLEASNR
jgi:DNA-binding NtrC family response regulator